MPTSGKASVCSALMRLTSLADRNLIKLNIAGPGFKNFATLNPPSLPLFPINAAAFVYNEEFSILSLNLTNFNPGPGNFFERVIAGNGASQLIPFPDYALAYNMESFVYAL